MEPRVSALTSTRWPFCSISSTLAPLVPCTTVTFGVSSGPLVNRHVEPMVFLAMITPDFGQMITNQAAIIDREKMLMFFTHLTIRRNGPLAFLSHYKIKEISSVAEKLIVASSQRGPLAIWIRAFLGKVIPAIEKLFPLFVGGAKPLENIVGIATLDVSGLYHRQHDFFFKNVSAMNLPELIGISGVIVLKLPNRKLVANPKHKSSGFLRLYRQGSSC